MVREGREVRAVLMSSQQEAEIIQDGTGFIAEETRLKSHLHCCLVSRRAFSCLPFLPTHRKDLRTSSSHGNAFKAVRCLPGARLHSFPPQPAPNNLDLRGRLLKRELMSVVSDLQRKAMNKPTRRDFCLVTLNTGNQRLQRAQPHRRSIPESKYIYLIKRMRLHYSCLKMDSTSGHRFLDIQPLPPQEEKLHSGKNVFPLRETTYVLKKSCSPLSEVANFELYQASKY